MMLSSDTNAGRNTPHIPHARRDVRVRAARARWLTGILLALLVLVPSAAWGQRRKPKPRPPETPAAEAPAPEPSAAPSATTAPSAPPAEPAPTEHTAPPAPSAPPAAPTAGPEAPPAAAGPAPVAVETHIKPAAPAPPVVRSVTAPVIVSGAIAGVELASGVVFAIMAASKHSEYQDEPDNDVANTGERNAFIADVSFGVAALFGLTALALYMLPDEASPAEPAKATMAPRTARRSVPAAGSLQRPGSWARAVLGGQVLRF